MFLINRAATLINRSDMADKFQSANLTALRNTPAQVKGVIQDFLTGREKIIQTTSLHAFADIETRRTKKQEAKQKVDDLKASSIEKLRQMEKSFDASHAGFMREISGAFRPPAADSNESLAREIAGQRIWNRTKSILDALDTDRLHGRVEEMVKEAVEAGDQFTLNTLRVELSSYFESRRQSKNLAVLLTQQIEAGLAANDPRVAAAIQARGEVEDGGGAYRAKMAINHAVFALEKDQTLAFVPAWSQSNGKDQVETIQIPEINFNE